MFLVARKIMVGGKEDLLRGSNASYRLVGILPTSVEVSL
jgi:hypothetical protein